VGGSHRVLLKMYFTVINLNPVVLDVPKPKNVNWRAATPCGAIVSIHSLISMVM
jgi:hypothetical protein